MFLTVISNSSVASGQTPFETLQTSLFSPRERLVMVVFAASGSVTVPVPDSTDHRPEEYSSGSVASRVVLNTYVSSWSGPALAVGFWSTVTVTGLMAEHPPAIVPLIK